MVFCEYLDIWIADGNFGKMMKLWKNGHIIPIYVEPGVPKAADNNFREMIVL